MAAPVFSGLDNNPNFTENGLRVLLDANATISDADLGPADAFDGATLTLSRAGGANPDDVFGAAGSTLSEGQVLVTEIVGMDSNDVVIGSYTNGGGVLAIVFNPNATAVRINVALQKLTYQNESEAPPASPVQINYVFDDGEQATGSITVGITPVNDSPTIDGLTPAFYRPGSAGVVLSPAILPADVDSASLTGATVSLNAHDATDLLTVNVGSSGIAANYNAATGVLTLTGPATIETYRQVLATVAYSSSAADPSSFGVTRTVTWSVNDGSSAPTTGSTLDFFPAIDLDQSGGGTGFATTFTEGGAAVTIGDTDLHITLTSTVIDTATVVLTNAKAGDTLSAPGAPFPFTVDNSVPGRITLTFSSSAGGDFEAALRSVVFGNASANVDPTTRDITVIVADANNTSNTAHSTITVSAVNDPGSAQNDSATAASDAVLSVAAAMGVLANDTDPDGLTIITGNVATTHGGMIQFGSDGSYAYTSASHFTGTDTVGYTAQDPFGSQVSAVLSIDVILPERAGTSGDDGFTAASGTERIDAGAGIDAVTFGFRLVDATVSYAGNTVIIDGPSSHTILTGVETYAFTDGTVNNNDGNPLVDDLFYYSHYHDVWNAHADADQHYNDTGWHDLRDPNAFFSTLIYLSANPDVKAAGANPLTHFDQFGWMEGRAPSLAFDEAKYLADNPDVAAAHIDPLTHFLQNGAGEGRQPVAPTELLAANGFDFVYYLNNNPDVAAAGIDPFQHFETTGWHEGRNPNALFDTAGYLATYTDVAAAGVNPLDHFHQNGWTEGRDPSVAFDTTEYLSHYGDVAAAHVDPLVHFLQFGVHEGRSAFADGIWG